MEEVIYRFPKSTEGVAQIKSFGNALNCAGRKWWAAGAVVGLVGSFVFPVVSALIQRTVKTSGTSLIVRTFTVASTLAIVPLLIVGVCCLLRLVTYSTPQNEGSFRQLPDTTKHRSKVASVLLVLFIFLCVPVGGAAQLPSQSDREKMLIERIERLERRLSELEAQLNHDKRSARDTKESTVVDSPLTDVSEIETPVVIQPDHTDGDVVDFFRDTTFNLTFDGYYSYNFNRPVGGINLLRAYDVQSNSFSLNQAALVIENAPNVKKGKRYGFRLDFQYGQATETVQGSAANEPRPQVYRNLWQAYGTYVFDVGRGLTVDFGKWASSLGYETNYAKDNFNYSRSYYFNFLPFYHFGFRTKYPINDKVTLMYHLVNGVQQSEDFNGFKSHHIALSVTPTKRLSGQINYYFGQEQRDRNPALNPTLPTLPTQPGLSTDVIRPVPSGRLHVIDTYYTFNANDKWTFAIEGDYVVGRVFRDSSPATVWGGAGYANYQWTPKFALRTRLEYLAEKSSAAGGLFSGVTQALKEGTFTAEYKLADGFLVRGEYRRDWSNQPFFLREKPGLLKKEQNTATVGLIWWFGQKQGGW